MKSMYHRRWFRILPLIILAIVILVDMLQGVIPSSNAAGPNFLTYHDSFFLQLTVCILFSRQKLVE